MSYQTQILLIFVVLFSDLGQCFQPNQLKSLENQKFGHVWIYIPTYIHKYISTYILLCVVSYIIYATSKTVVFNVFEVENFT